MTAPEESPLALDVRGLAPEDGVPTLIDFAANLGVSDLFFCTNADHTAVLARQFGLIRPITKVSIDFGKQCLAHIKGVSGMDIAEKRRPMEGRWLMPRDGKGTLDVRISTIPTLYGEDASLRILDRDSRLLSLEQLGLPRRDYNQLVALLANPNGMIVFSGPTGSGTSTTLYACLHHLNNGERKINTIEDPVEYAIDGLRQSQVNTKLEVGYPELLRSVLRQAPDVIMIGEIRDPETAELAISAANSGHLVLATLQAPVATSVVAALLNLGVAPHFLASALLGSLSLRLVRRLCQVCRVGFDISGSPQTFEEVTQYLEQGQGDMIYGPKGCPTCHMLGFTGRTGVYEMMPMTTRLRKLILERATTKVPDASCHRRGVNPLPPGRVDQSRPGRNEHRRGIPRDPNRVSRCRLDGIA